MPIRKNISRGRFPFNRKWVVTLRWSCPSHWNRCLHCTTMKWNNIQYVLLLKHNLAHIGPSALLIGIGGLLLDDIIGPLLGETAPSLYTNIV